MIYYIDDFMTKLVKAHNAVQTDQKKAVSIIKNTIETFKPEDEEILFLLNSACDVGMDSPIKFKSFITQAIDKVEGNHSLMMQQFNNRKRQNGKQNTEQNTEDS